MPQKSLKHAPIAVDKHCSARTRKMLEQLDSMIVNLYDTAEVAGETGHYFIADRLDDALFDLTLAIYDVLDHRESIH